jgi:hypothetical protein
MNIVPEEFFDIEKKEAKEAEELKGLSEETKIKIELAEKELNKPIYDDFPERESAKAVARSSIILNEDGFLEKLAERWSNNPTATSIITDIKRIRDGHLKVVIKDNFNKLLETVDRLKKSGDLKKLKIFFGAFGAAVVSLTVLVVILEVMDALDNENVLPAN